MRHALVIELKKLFPGSRFVAIGSARDKLVSRFLKEQKDLQYAEVYDFDDITTDAFRGEVDHALLKEFEEFIPEKSLWRLIAVDREWGWQYMKGVYQLDSYIKTINTQENILKMFSGYLKFYSALLDEFQIDVFMPATGQNSMSCPIIEQVCKMKNVHYLLPDFPRTLNYIALTDDRQYTFPQIGETCREFMDGKDDPALAEGEKLYQEIIEDVNNKKYTNVSHIGHLRSSVPWLAFAQNFCKSTLGVLKRWVKDQSLLKTTDTLTRQPDSIRTLLNNINYYAFQTHLRRMQLMKPDFYTAFNRAWKYLYFPLHLTNEYSTQVQGTMWIDHLPLIEMLSKSVPYDWKVVIKEHPGILLYRVRPKAFYDEIKKYPNVVLVPTDTNTYQLIQNSQLVVSIVGTTGWEALFRGKPVVTLEPNMYDVLELSRMCTDIKQFSIVIHDELVRIQQITPAERKRRLVCFLAALHKHGVWVDVPARINGEIDCANDAQRLEYGRVFANNIKEYLSIKDPARLKKEGITTGV